VGHNLTPSHSHDTLEKILNAPTVFKSQIIPMYQLLKQDLTEVDIVIPEDFEQKEINARWWLDYWQ
jgi:hypothetical protein